MEWFHPLSQLSLVLLLQVSVVALSRLIQEEEVVVSLGQQKDESMFAGQKKVDRCVQVLV